MTYKQAIFQLKKTGCARATGEVHLAMCCDVLSAIHAVNPELVFEGAKKKKIDGRSLMKLSHDDPVKMGDLMFE